MALAQFQSTLPARGATCNNPRSAHDRLISIHAPRTGSDRVPGCTKRPRGGRFQSTLPARGATGVPERHRATEHDFNPRSPHGERRLDPERLIRSLLYFNPRSPHGERRVPERHRATEHDFNPRSPHGERRATARRVTPQSFHFNPRSPHGERPAHSAFAASASAFQSTLPARGATGAMTTFFIPIVISIHAPRTGSDRNRRVHFGGFEISIHAPRTGSDSAK